MKIPRSLAVVVNDSMSALKLSATAETADVKKPPQLQADALAAVGIGAGAGAGTAAGAGGAGAMVTGVASFFLMGCCDTADDDGRDWPGGAPDFLPPARVGEAG